MRWAIDILKMAILIESSRVPSEIERYIIVYLEACLRPLVHIELKQKIATVGLFQKCNNLKTALQI
jgi:hypothetical protein